MSTSGHLATLPPFLTSPALCTGRVRWQSKLKIQILQRRLMRSLTSM
jgi:hypothetical protein